MLLRSAMTRLRVPQTRLNIDAPLVPRTTELVVASLAFVLLTVALTFPQVLHLTSRAGPHYDALFSIWRIAWVAHQLRNDPLHLFDANIFHPEPNTLAYSDAILLLGALAAPFIWAGASPTVVYNVLVLLSFVSAGLAMYFFIRSLQASRGASALAGIAFAFHPYRFAHYPQIELLWTCWIPLAFWALHRLVATRQARYGTLLGLFIGLQALSCLYYAVFLVTVLPVLALMLGARRLQWSDFWSFWKPVASAVLAAGLLVAPYARPYMRLGETGTVRRTLEEAEQWSPTFQNYFIAQAGHWLYPPPPAPINPFEGVLFPGTVVLLLAFIGLIGQPRRLAIAYGIVVLLAFDISLGTNGYLFAHLFNLGFPYTGLRVPARMFVIVSAGLGVLIAVGAGSIEKLFRPAIWLALILLVADTVSAPIPLDATPTVSRAYAWLAKQPHGPVFEWPVPRLSAIGITQDPRYMYFSTRHWQPLLNGYSGHHPESYVELLERMRLMRFPRADAIEYLRRRGVKYVIVHSKDTGPQPPPEVYRTVVNAMIDVPALQLQFALRGPDAVAVFLVR